MKHRILMLAVALLTPAAYAGEIRREALTIEFEGFETAAELTLPADGKVRAGVLLLHGATPADMNFTVRGFDGQVKSAILKDVAEYLSANGFAALRYNKRHVHGPGRVDAAAYAGLGLDDLLADADRALDTLAQHPALRNKPLIVYGWSEGSLLAGALAASRSDLAGVILQGPVADPAPEVFRRQVAEVTADFVEQLTGSDRIDGNAASKVFASSAGMMVKAYVGMTLDPAAAAARPRINRGLDADGNGAISLREELAPFMQMRAASYLPAAPAFPVKPLLLQTEALRQLPVLILHGRNDANVPVDNGQRLAAALGERASYREYPQLGHSLGVAATTAEDDFRPIDLQALADMVAWLQTSDL